MTHGFFRGEVVKVLVGASLSKTILTALEMAVAKKSIGSKGSPDRRLADNGGAST